MFLCCLFRIKKSYPCVNCGKPSKDANTWLCDACASTPHRLSQNYIL